MKKVRIYNLSKEIGVSNKDILKVLEDMGISGKTHSSSIDVELAAEVTRRLKPEKEKRPPEVKGKEKEEKKATEEEKREVPEKERPPEKKEVIKKDKRPSPEPVLETQEEEDLEEELVIPDRFKKEIVDQKVEKLRSRNLQRALQTLRKVEPKPKIQPKPYRPHKKKPKPAGGPQPATAPAQPVPTQPRKKALKIPEGTTVKEFAELIGQKVTDVIKKFMELGMLVTINQVVDMDAAVIVAESFGIKVEAGTAPEAALEEMLETEVQDRPEELRPRAPVVTVMGHVDHGKTSLLDAIRQTKVVATEAGGITQHIGAYKVRLKDKDIVFLDTPGHEAFTTMRARGAQVTDIVVLVVAADDGVMPQTVEAINHAKAADVPIIVAVNKIDKPEANPQKVRTQLAEHGIVPEEWGGNNIFVDVSAKKKIGIEDLLEMILLQAEMMELKANPNKPARGVIIESKLDRGRGPVATVLVQEGTLRVGDDFVTGVTYGRVRALYDDDGNRINEAGPSTPVEVLGFNEVPQAGDKFVVVDNERIARQIAYERQHRQRLAQMAKAKKMNLEEIFKKIQEGEVRELNIIIKADVQGSVEALKSALEKIEHPEVKVRVIHTAVGGITESDVMLAAASGAIIIGFNVRPEPMASKTAEKEGVDIRLYNVIYEAIDDVKKALSGLLEPTKKETVIGRAEVRQVFSISRIGNVAGCYVLEGVIRRNSDGIRVIRDNIVVYTGKIGSLKRFKEDVREVQAGYECGILIENFNDIKVGDILENFIIEEVARTID